MISANRSQKSAGSHLWFLDPYELSGYLILILVLAYVSLRAYLLPIMHDESVTFLYYIWSKKSFYEIITYDVPNANNHILNTVIMKISSSLLGYSQFALRIAPLFGCVLYCFGMFQVLKLLLKGPFSLAALLLCVTHPFLINYFAQAKGYALALGFMSWGLYFSFKRLQQGWHQSGRGILYVTLSCGLLSFAVLSHLTFLNVLLPMVCLFVVLEAESWRREGRHGAVIVPLRKLAIMRILLPIVPCLFFLAVIYTGPVVTLLSADEFYVGGHQGFWTDTVGSLIRRSIYYDFAYPEAVVAELVKWLKPAVGVLYGLGIGAVLFRFLRKRIFDRIDQCTIWLAGLMFLSALSSVLQHLLFGVLYGMGRTAMFLIPIFSVFFVLLLRRFQTADLRFGRVPSAIVYAVAVGLIGYFLSCVSLKEHYGRNGTDIDQVMEDIVTLKKAGVFPKPAIRIGARWANTPMFNYYIIRDNLRWIHLLPRERDFSNTDNRYDCYHIFQQDQGLIQKHDLVAVKHYELTDSYLAIPKVYLDHHLNRAPSG